jgi:hypothetical protein
MTNRKIAPSPVSPGFRFRGIADMAGSWCRLDLVAIDS